jgi:hypothetical protein
MTQVRKEVLYSMLTEFGIHMKLIRLIKMCLNETCNKVCIGKNLMHFLSQIACYKKMLYQH